MDYETRNNGELFLTLAELRIDRDTYAAIAWQYLSPFEREFLLDTKQNIAAIEAILNARGYDTAQ